MWLGMNNIKDGKVPVVWPIDKTPVNYQRWDSKAGYPSSAHERDTLIVNSKEGLWRNAKKDNPDYKRTCYCQKPSVPGEPPVRVRQSYRIFSYFL